VFCLGLKKLAGKSGNLNMSRDMIGDFLTIIRNGLKVNKRSVVVPSSILKVEIAKVLKEEGYIKDFKVSEEDAKKSLTIFLKYVDGESVIHEIKSVSTPGRRQYENSKSVTSVIGGLGISILTTSSGVVTDRQAKKLNVGGEVICHVW
jgi:small subunit ribosomal protein S8